MDSTSPTAERIAGTNRSISGVGTMLFGTFNWTSVEKPVRRSAASPEHGRSHRRDPNGQGSSL